MANEGVVLVGNVKPVMNYVLAVVTLFNQGSKTVIVKARGRAINKAIDTIEVVRRRFLSNVKPTKVEIGTEVVKNEDNSTINLSTIEIYLEQVNA